MDRQRQETGDPGKADRGNRYAGRKKHPCQSVAEITSSKELLSDKMRRTNTVMQVDELLAYLFDGQPHILAPSMERWLAASRLFTAFVTTFRDKIRKKLRTAQDPETLQDLQLE